ncbi:MAG: aspartate-semialdehyde dehydrogenase [Planctomycetota bacterium]
MTPQLEEFRNLTRPPWGWTADHRRQRIGIIGATGAVGRELLSLLHAAGHGAERVECAARARTEVVLANGARFAVRELASLDTQSWDVAFLCTPSEVSRALARPLAQTGVRVIDLSSEHRMHPDVPLVIPEINGRELEGDVRLIANPNCTTAVAALPLAVLDRAAELEEVHVVSFQAASGVGASGLVTLAHELAHHAHDAALSAPASPFPAPLLLNVIPAVATVDAHGVSGEERKIMNELARILSRPGLPVEATTTRVAVERCHCVAVHARFVRDLDVDEAREHLRAAPGIVVSDDPHGPRPRECAGSDPVHVGRIRAGTRRKRSLCFFAVGDQLRKGAALNALQIAACLPATPSPRS